MDARKQRTLRSVSEFACIETWLGSAGRHVDPAFQRSGRHYVGFVRDLVEAGSVEFVEDAVEHVGLFFVAEKAGAQRFIIDAGASKSTFFETSSSRTIAYRRETLSSRNFRTLRTGLWVRPMSRTRFHQMRILEFLQAFSALPAVLASEVGCTGKAVDQKRLVSDSLIHLLPTTLPMGLSWAMIFCQHAHGKC